MASYDENMTLLRYLDTYARDQANEIYMVDRKRGKEVSYTFAQVQETVESVARSLGTLFAGGGNSISILSKNRAHWAMCDLGVLRSGNVLAPVFATMLADTFHFAIEFTAIKLLFVGEAANWDEVKGVLPASVKIVSLPGVDIPEAHLTFDQFIALGADTRLPDHPNPEALCTIVFTSGTTGMPKGVMHSLQTLNAFVATVCAFAEEQERFFSYLPLAHLGDRAASVFQSLHVGGRITFNDTVDTFVTDLMAAAPTFLMGVPRIWEKLLQGVLATTGMDSDTLKAELQTGVGGELAQRIREGLGLHNARFLVAATAATSDSIKQWYALLGMPLHDVYGQTEICPVSCSPPAQDGRAGVGAPCPGFDVRIAEDGEIVCSGPGTALGYYNNLEKTAETFVDGWVHTGDKGYLDQQGYLHITGRVKDTFKTAKGKYVAPGPIENRFASSVLVEQQCLYGFSLTQPIMLCTLSASAAEDKAEIDGKLVAHTEWVNQSLESHEKIGGLIISVTSWSTESGVLTHTLKVKRDKVAQRYQKEIEGVASQLMDSDRSLVVEWAQCS